MTLSTLLTRLETATEADQAEVLEMAWYILFGKQWFHCHTRASFRFKALLDAAAYTDAALLIMREVLPGCAYTIGGPYWASKVYSATIEIDGLEYTAEAKTESLAIIAAICAAKGDGDAE